MIAISFEGLAILLAVLGAVMMGCSIFIKEYAAGLYGVGRVFLIVGIVLFVILLVLG